MLEEEEEEEKKYFFFGIDSETPWKLRIKVLALAKKYILFDGVMCNAISGFFFFRVLKLYE